MANVVDWVWRKPLWCRVSREHVPDPGDLFRDDAVCLRCGCEYDDGVAQVHRQYRLIARGRVMHPRRKPVAGLKRRRVPDHG